MSQAGTLNAENINPDIPLIFKADMGEAVAQAHIIVVSGVNGISTSGNDNVITIDGSALKLTLTGNPPGMPISSIAQNFTIKTDNSTPVFVGTAGVLTLDFDLENLLLGSSGDSISDSTDNVGYGAGALESIEECNSNVAIGYNSCQMMVESDSNTAVGAESLNSYTDGEGENTAIGYSALFSLDSGTENIAIGAFAGASLTGGATGNIMIGADRAGVNNQIIIGDGQTTCFISGIYNVAIDPAQSATLVISSGSAQLGRMPYGTFGQFLFSLGDGELPEWRDSNAIEDIILNQGTIYGLPTNDVSLLTANSTAIFGTSDHKAAVLDFGLPNLLIGTSGVSITTATNNASLGLAAMQAITSGTGNSALGFSALNGIASGTANTAIGVGAGSAYTNAESFNILIFNSGVIGDNNTIRIGDPAYQATKTYIAGVYNVASAGLQAVGVGADGHLCTLGDGAAGQVLTSGGAGVTPTWSPAAGSTAVAVQTFKASDTYTPTFGMQYCMIECWGAGGGGGGASVGDIANYGTGGGGAGGNYARQLFSAATIGVSQVVTVGDGGAGGLGDIPLGGDSGGSTGVGALIIAYGGNGGNGSISGSGTIAAGGGSTGSLSGAEVELLGCGGGVGFGVTDSSFAYGGLGGNSPGQSQIFGPFTVGFGAVVDTGVSAPANSGCGGSGGLWIGDVSSSDGGAGGSGLVVITEYI